MDATVVTFARHEARLMWRDMSTMLTAGRTYRGPLVMTVALGVYVGLHPLADHTLQRYIAGGLSEKIPTLLVVSGLLAMLFSLMASQAIEALTRAYFGRSDLDLILSSPAPLGRLFAVRAVVIAAQSTGLSLLIASPVLNVLAWRVGGHMLLGYPLLIGLSLVATASALGISLGLLRWFGPARARLTAQVVSAFVGAGFVIALQAFAIMGGGQLDRMSLFSDPAVIASAPDGSSWVWVFAHAALGDLWSLVPVLATSLVVFTVAVHFSASRFAGDALAASEIARSDAGTDRFRGFTKRAGVRAALRAKEWALLKRDPWLLSQSLQQVLYMIPPALLLFVSYGEDRSVLFVVVPVIVMAVGQLAGGLAWLAISGEDAHELIVTAPVQARDVLVAKVQAVAGIVAWVVLPLALALFPISAKAALAVLLGAGASAASATTVQLWFRAQANRSFFRRRQVSSRAATICEAMVSINCAALACLYMADMWAALYAGPALALAGTFAMAWIMRPAGNR